MENGAVSAIFVELDWAEQERSGPTPQLIGTSSLSPSPSLSDEWRVGTHFLRTGIGY